MLRSLFVSFVKGLFQGKFARLAKSVTAARKAVGEKHNVVHPTDMDVDATQQGSESEEGSLPRYMREAPQVGTNYSYFKQFCIERVRDNFKVPKYTILHTSGFKQIWNWTIFILTVYTALSAPFDLVFGSLTENYHYVELINLCVDTAFILDIVISFRTTYVGNGLEVVSNGRMIRQNYLRGWFAIDFISSAPLEIVDIAYRQVKPGDNRIIANLRVLKLIRLLRLFRVLRTLDHYMEYAGGRTPPSPPQKKPSYGKYENVFSFRRSAFDVS